MSSPGASLSSTFDTSVTGLDRVRSLREKTFSGETILQRVAIFFGIFWFGVLSRFFFLIMHDGHGEGSLVYSYALRWMHTGVYKFQRQPGTPVYDVFMGAIGLVIENWPIPYYFVTNLFSVLASTVTLFFVYLLFRKFWNQRQALLAVALVHFQPQFYTTGSSTYEMALMLTFIVLSFYCFVERRIVLAHVFGYLAMGCKMIGAVALGPVMLWTLWELAQKKKWPSIVGLIAVYCAAWFVLFFPVFQMFGDWKAFILNFLIQPHHQYYSFWYKLGAFFHRSLNVFGTVGVPILVAILYQNRDKIRKLEPPLRFALVAGVLINIALMFVAPWEMYYFFPVIPLAVAVVLRWAPNNRWKVIFFLSYLSPLLFQVHFKPWKAPFFILREGVMSTHMSRTWGVRGGG